MTNENLEGPQGFLEEAIDNSFSKLTVHVEFILRSLLGTSSPKSDHRDLSNDDTLSELRAAFSENVEPMLKFTVIFQAVDVSLSRAQHRHQVATLISIKKFNR